MKEVSGNIWGYYNDDEWIILPTNGTVDGEGNAYVWDISATAQAGLIFEEFVSDLGAKIKSKGNVPICLEKYKIITIPVKSSKDDKSSLDLIKKHLQEVIKIVDKQKLENVYISLPGCNAKTKNEIHYRKELKPAIKDILDDRFNIIVE
jgi:hypothetical protein